MAFNKKYSGLPDLDLAPDIYETPELTDSSTLPTTTVRSSSPIQDDSENPHIDRQRLQPDEARSHFMPSRVDARDVNFSDSIASRKKSYRTLTRTTRRRREDGTEILGDISDEEDETLERRLARLRREAEELKAEIDAQKAQKDAEQAEASDEEGGVDELTDGVLELSRALDNLHTVTSGGGGAQPASAEEMLSQKLSTGLSYSSPGNKQQSSLALRASQPSNIPAGILSNAASFETRLTALEAALGIPNTPLPISPDDPSDHGIQPLLPTLTHLSSQLTTLSTTLSGPTAPTGPSSSSAQSSTAITTPHIEALATRIRKLTADADALSAARRRATEAVRAAIAARLAATTSPDAAVEHADTLSASSAQELDSAANEQAARIQALYTTLPTITSLHPLLPSVLERLRSLRAIHAGAAHASEDLAALEQRQAEMKKEIEQWREGLKVVEEKVRESEGAMKGNMEVMGPWVRDLEARMGRLEA